MGSVPGEGFRAVMGSGFADDPSLASTGASTLPAAPPVDMEDDALPMTTGFVAAGLQAPPMPEHKPLMGAPMPASGEEAVRVAAYYRFLDRVRYGQSGDETGDWLQAESEMMLSLTAQVIVAHEGAHRVLATSPLCLELRLATCTRNID